MRALGRQVSEDPATIRYPVQQIRSHLRPVWRQPRRPDMGAQYFAKPSKFFESAICLPAVCHSRCEVFALGIRCPWSQHVCTAVGSSANLLRPAEIDDRTTACMFVACVQCAETRVDSLSRVRGRMHENLPNAHYSACAGRLQVQVSTRHRRTCPYA